MVFPVQTNSNTEIEYHFPGWCSFQVNGRGRVVFPSDGYFYMTRPTAPIGFISGDTRENILIFVPNNIRSVVRHPFWDTPIPNFFAFRFRSPNPSFEVMVENILSRTQSENSMSVIEASTIRIGHEDRTRLISSMDTYPIGSENEREETVREFRREWGEGDYLVIPVSEGQEIWEFSSSFTVDLLIGRTHENVVGSPFDTYTYYFDTQNFLKRLSLGGLVQDIPNNLNWDYNHLISSFLTSENEIIPFDIIKLSGHFSHNRTPENYIKITGGYQNVSLTIPFIQNGGGTVIPEIINLFHDSLYDTGLSLNAGDSIILKIASNVEREVFIGTRRIEGDQIRFSDLNISEIDNGEAVVFNIGSHSVNCYFGEDVFRKTLNLLGELAEIKLRIMQKTEEVLDGTQENDIPVKVGHLAILDDVTKNLINAANIRVDRRYFNSGDVPRVLREFRSLNEESNRIMNALDINCLRNSSFYFYMYFFASEEKASLYLQVLSLLENFPEGKSLIQSRTESLFIEETGSIGVGLNIEGVNAMLSVHESLNSLPLAMLQVVSSAIVRNAHEHTRLASMMGISLRTAVMRRYETLYIPILRRFDVELSYNPTNQSVEFRTPVSYGEHGVRVLTLLTSALSLILTLDNLKTEYQSGNYLQSILRGTQAIINMGSFIINTTQYIVSHVFSAERILRWSPSAQNTISFLLRNDRQITTSLYRGGQRIDAVRTNTSLLGILGFASVIADNSIIYLNMYRDRHNPRAVECLAWQSGISWATFGIGLTLGMLSFPVAGVVVGLISFGFSLYINARLDRTRSLYVYPPPSILFFISNSYLGSGRRTAPEVSEAVTNLSRNEWFRNIHRQISIAYSWLLPIQQLSSVYRNHGTYSDGSSNDYFEFVFRMPYFSEILYAGIIFYSPDEEEDDFDSGSGDLMKIVFQHDGSYNATSIPHSEPEQNSGDNRLTVVGAQNWGGDGVDLILRWSTRYLEPRVFQKYRIILSLNDPAIYFDRLGESSEINFDQLNNYPFTTRREFPIPSIT